MDFDLSAEQQDLVERGAAAGREWRQPSLSTRLRGTDETRGVRLVGRCVVFG